MDKILLFNIKEDCCGCGACYNICPKDAISMIKDEDGFIYPNIDYGNCIHCELCKKVCSYQNDNPEYAPFEVFAAIDKRDERLKRSASGGAFSALAFQVLSNGGVVYGCAYKRIEDSLIPAHVKIMSIEELPLIQGSKYVQSDTHLIFRDLKEEVTAGRQVLFSGTPCQIAACRKFLNKDYSNLLLVDIICHGVPNAVFFNDYLKVLEKKVGGSIIDFSFRDKTKGWGLKGSFKYLKDGQQYNKLLNIIESSYYTFFLQAEIYRANCYSCKYAGEKRVGDLTIGDFWGIQKEHPEYLIENGGVLDVKKGISCILVNTIQGKKRLSELGMDLITLPSEFSKVARGNGQLNVPSKRSPRRDSIFKIYHENGYEALDKWYYKQMGVKRYIRFLWYMLPDSIKSLIKCLVNVTKQSI